MSILFIAIMKTCEARETREHVGYMGGILHTEHHYNLTSANHTEEAIKEWLILAELPTSNKFEEQCKLLCQYKVPLLWKYRVYSVNEQSFVTVALQPPPK